MRATHLGQGAEQFLPVNTEAVRHREQEVLDGQEIVTQI